MGKWRRLANSWTVIPGWRVWDPKGASEFSSVWKQTQTQHVCTHMHSDVIFNLPVADLESPMGNELAISVSSRRGISAQVSPAPRFLHGTPNYQYALSSAGILPVLRADVGVLSCGVYVTVERKEYQQGDIKST